MKLLDPEPSFFLVYHFKLFYFIFLNHYFVSQGIFKILFYYRNSKKEKK